VKWKLRADYDREVAGTVAPPWVPYYAELAAAGEADSSTALEESDYYDFIPTPDAVQLFPELACNDGVRHFIPQHGHDWPTAAVLEDLP
jgi:hypothetical protein